MASERMTSICIPGECGWAEWGRKTVPEMIAAYRSYGERLKQQSEKILAAKDEEFHVETYVGVHVQKQRETLQEGAKEST